VDAVAAPDATVLLLVWPKRRPLIRGRAAAIAAAFPGWPVANVEPRLSAAQLMELKPDEH
jgi:hypothetical protein